MINNILFDLDGTLTQSDMGIVNSVAYALDKMGINDYEKENLKCFVGPPLLESFEKYFNMDTKTAQKAVTFYREYFSVKGLYENEMYQGIRQMLESLKGKKIYLATSKPEVFAKKILEYFDIDKHFVFVCGSELNGDRTAKKDVIKYVLDSCKLDAENCVMVGDREHDIIGAKANKMKSIGVLYGYGNTQELQNAKADVIVKTVMDLQNYLSFEQV